MKSTRMLLWTLASLAAFTSFNLWGVPACPEPVEVTQSDGTKATIHIRGDEFLHWNEDVAGYTVVQDAVSKDWVYAELNSDGTELVPTSTRVGSVRAESLSVPKRLMPAQKIEKAAAQKASQMEATVSRTALRTSGTVRQLVLLVEFSDLRFTKTKQNFEDLFNKVGYSGEGNAGSLRDFYKEISYGKLTVESTVMGPFRLDNTYAYYGANGSDGDAKAYELGAHALAKLAAQYPNFNWSQFDMDNDGWFDELDIIHAGWGEEYGGNSSDNIWSARWSWRAGYYYAQYGGLKFGSFHTEPELRGLETATTKKIMQVGVVCHEFGHSLGLPDLYDTSYNSEGAGNFCLMAGGSWGYASGGDQGTCPVHMSAWCKEKLGWVTPTEISAAGTYTLNRVEDNSTIFKLRGNFPSTQYFLLENKTGTGFDRALPGTTRGMLIWHVDNTKSANSDRTHYMVDLEEPSSTQHLETRSYGRGNDSDYFRSGTMTSFTGSTNPNNKSYSGTALGLDITQISAAGSTMTFLINGGGVSVPDAPTVRINTWGPYANTDSIDVTWNSVSGATSYDIYRSTSTTRPSAPIARNVSSPYCDPVSGGLQPGVKYYYWVSAANSAGTSYSSSDWGNIAVSLTLGEDTLAFRASGGTMNVPVTANTSWSLVSEGSWIHATTPNGMSGNGTVAVTADANNGDARSGSISIVAGSGTTYPVTKTITVTQDKKEVVEFVVENHVLVGYNGNGGSVTVPQVEPTTSQVIREIGDEVFKNNVSITSVSLPNTVTNIGKYAFYGCANMTSVSFGTGVKTIGNWSFQNTGLTSVSLPNSVETIGTAAFFGCEALETVNLASVRKIMYGAFYGCTLLRSISIPNTVTNMGEGSTFYDCVALSSVSIGSGLKTIPQNCFYCCAALRNVTIPSTVSNLEFRAFFACTNLVNVTLNNGVKALGNNAFDECTALKEITIPASVKSMGNYAFIKCSALTNVTYLGNAPSVEPGIYRASNEALVSYVSRDSTGWNGTPGSTVLPSRFPSNGGNDARAIVRDMGDPPGKPVVYIATRGENANYDNITVTWTAAAGAVSYNLYRSSTETRPTTPVGSGVTSPYVDAKTAGLQPGVRYNYWVEAVNEAGSTYSEPEWGEIAVEPEVVRPAEPVITAISGDENGVWLEWNEAEGAETYSVYRSTSVGQTGELIVNSLSGLTYFDTNAEPGVDYFYRVAAANGAGESVSMPATDYRRVALSVDRSNISLLADGSVVALSLEANGSWMMAACDSWLGVTPDTGSGNAALSVSAEENTETSSRSGSITFLSAVSTAHPKMVTVNVTQASAERRPPSGSGLINDLQVRRYWPDANEGTLDCTFSLVLAQGVSELPLEIAVVDTDYDTDVTENCSMSDITDSDNVVYFSDGDERTAGSYRFKINYYGFGGTKGLKVCVRVQGGEWEMAAPVRVAFGDQLLATGIEPWWNGTLGGETNTTLLANGLYDFGFAPIPANEDVPSQFLRIYNSETMLVEEGRLSSNTVWTAEKVHVLRGDVVVPPGVTLTIGNGTCVRRFDGNSLIYVEDGGAVRLQGVEFQDFTLGEEVPDVRGASGVSAEDFVEYENGNGTLGGVITGTDFDTDFSFYYSYTLGERVERLPEPPSGSVPDAFGGWTWLDENASNVVVDPQLTIQDGVFDTAEIPFALSVDPKWIPAMPTNVCAYVRGAGILDADVGHQVVIEWDPVLSAMVNGYEIVFLREGEEPAEGAWESVSESPYTCEDVPDAWGIYGGETVYCRVRAVTGDGERGAAAEFSFTLPLVLDLRQPSGTVSEFGGSEDVYLERVNVKWRAESDASWIHVTTQFDENEIRTYFSYAADPTDQATTRTGRIRVIGGGAVRTYTVVQGGDPVLETKVATPVILPADGAAFDSETCPVTIECDTVGSTIYYTLDGSVPSRSSTQYANGFNITNTTTIKAIAVADDKEDSDVVVSTITKTPPLTLADALDLAAGMAVTTTGTSRWMPTLDGTAVGGSSARSGRIGTGDSTAMSITVSGSGTLTFKWKSDCLSDPNGSYTNDYGSVAVDGGVVRRIDGTVGWQTVTVEVSGSGTHTIQWAYTKNARNEYIVVGEDCVWVDYVVWTPGGAGGQDVTIDLGGGKSITIPKSWFEQYPALLARYGNSYSAMALAASGKYDRRGNALYIWQDYVAGTNPTDPNSVFKVKSFKYENGTITITWDPDLNENGTKSLRRYKTYGAESLNQAQWDLIETNRPNAKYKFFAVEVEMP